MKININHKDLNAVIVQTLTYLENDSLVHKKNCVNTTWKDVLWLTQK